MVSNVMSDQLDKLNTVVVKRYGTGESSELALVVSICDAPTYTLLDVSGARYSWRQDLTRPATADESIRYWRERAETAERLLDKSIAQSHRAIELNMELAERLNRRNQ